MGHNYYYDFKYKVILAEAEGDETPPAEEPAAATPAPTEEPQSDLEKILSKSKKVTYTLVKLLSTYDTVTQKSKDELRDLVNDIRCMSYKPTTFRVVLSNNNFFDLKYDPAPLQLKYPNDYKPIDFFYVDVLGKKYSLSNKSEYEQAIDYIQKIQREKPILIKEPGEGEPGGPAGGPTATPAEAPPAGAEEKPAPEK